MIDRPHIEIQVTSQPIYVGVVRAAVQTMAGKLGFSNEQSGHIILAVDEALTNVIRHGYHGKNDQPIWIKLTPIHGIDRAGLEIVIEDQSQGVDISKIKGRPLDEIRPGGLGVHIIQQMMDDVTYSQRTDTEGLRLRMCKYIQAQDAPTPAHVHESQAQVGKV